ncbi:MAG TPA: ABC transporter ATP-binding protein [Candidatus Limiplasma sp.]|nr:ABC transporter ATP-binding protein [Candidatus Limiplasma sp.]HRX09811.1 ABC transporter ATP-binding protein [Candidatus Limiplasma sp.]
MITANNVTKRFQDIVALDHLSCHIPDSCVYGLVGANGAGKSTFLRLLSGVYKPDEGSVLMNQQHVFENKEAKKRSVFIADEFWALPRADMKRMSALYASVYEAYDPKKFLALADEFGLPVDRPLNTFSKGMRRQAAIIQALSTGADVYLFDETFDGLDPVMRSLVKKKLYDEVFDRGATVIVTSHSLRELEDTCDQLALLYKGGIVLESDVNELKTSIIKMQIAFAEQYDKDKFEGLDIVSFAKLGSVSTLIVRGEKMECQKKLEAMDPLLLEMVPITLEEIFVYEMEALGYVFDKGDSEQ